MSELSEYVIIAQVESEAGSGMNSSTSQVNAYLKRGWKIISIDRRGYEYPSEGARFVTVFVLGHTNLHATYPKQDPYSKRWE